MQMKNNFIKGSRILAILSIILIICSFVQVLAGYYVVSNIVSILLWIVVLVCSIKGW